MIVAVLSIHSAILSRLIAIAEAAYSSKLFVGMLSNSGGGSGGGTLQQLQMLLREAEVRESQLTLLVDQSDKAKLDLDRQLEEERRKVEDLHFR